MRSHHTLLAATFALGLLAASAPPAAAQVIENLLSEDDIALLAPRAAELYREAARKADHANYPGAMEDLAAAAQADSSAVELQFLAAKYARQSAESSYGEDSLRYYDIAEQALRRLLANPALSPEDRARVTRESDRIRLGKEGLRARDQARLDTGMRLVNNIRQQRLLSSGILEKQARAKGTTIEEILASQPVAEEQTGKTIYDIWPVLNAPGLAVSIGPVQAQQPAAAGAPAGFDPFAAQGFGAPGAGLDPFAAQGFGDPGMGAGAYDPFAPQPAAGAFDPFAPAPGAAPANSDPFLMDPSMTGGK